MATGQPDLRDEDRLPWLETADDGYDDGPGIGRVIVFVVLGLALIAAAIYGIYWYKNREAQTGGGALIAAQEGDYKVKPDEPGGMKVDGEGDTALTTSQGGAPGNAAIDLKAAPEAPVAGTKASTAAAPVVATGKTTAIPASGGALKATAPGAPSPPVAAAASGGALVQLGSFPSAAEANSQWAALSKRFGYLAPLGKSVESAEVNGRTVHRLRVNAGSAGAATTLCGKLKVAGEACFIPR